MEGKFQRPVSYLERGWLCVDRNGPPYANQVVLEGQGELDVEQLKRAVERASEANPGSRLVLKGFLRNCYWQDSGASPDVKLIEHCPWDGQSQDHAPFLQTRLPYNGPTCEVVYVKGNVPRLVFRSNHGVMDGVGTFTWMEDIFRILRGEAPVGSDSTLNENILARSLSDRTRKQSLVNGVAPTGKAAKYERGVAWRRMSFSGSPSKLLGKVAMALARSAWTYEAGPFRVYIPVDIRRRQPGLRSTGNLSIAILAEITPDSTPESIADDIKNQLENKNDLVLSEGRAYLDLIPFWMIDIGLNLLTRMALKNGRYSTPAIISNLGLVDTQRFRGGGFTTQSVFLIPPRMDILPAFVVLTGVPGRLEVTVSVPNALAGEGRFDRLLNDLRNALR